MRACPSQYELRRAATLHHALHLLGSGDGWRPMAGGTDLMVLLNAGKLPDSRFISVRHLPELRRIETEEQWFAIGAGVTYTEVRQHSSVAKELRLLSQAASWTGGIANQNRGTLGGNIANASPAADSAPALLVYEAELELTSTAGLRWLPYQEFHTGYKQMQLRPDELITRIRVKRPGGSALHYGRKVATRRAQAISKVCFAAMGERRGNFLEKVRIAIGSVAPIPLRCFKTERVLEGGHVNPHLIAEAVRVLRAEMQPISDGRSTGAYRAQVAVNLLRDFLERFA